MPTAFPNNFQLIHADKLIFEQLTRQFTTFLNDFMVFILIKNGVKYLLFPQLFLDRLLRIENHHKLLFLRIQVIQISLQRIYSLDFSFQFLTQYHTLPTIYVDDLEFYQKVSFPGIF